MKKYDELSDAIARTLLAIENTRNDYQSERLSFHLDKLLDAEVVYFDADYESEEYMDEIEEQDECAAENERDVAASKTPKSDEEKIAEKVQYVTRDSSHVR